MTVLLIILAIGFAYSMGAHYTGACMGMPYALRALSARAALLLMAPLTLIGATFASHRVEHTVGHSLLSGSGLSVDGLVIVIGVAFALTSLFNWLRIPTSTIQILVFSVVGAGIGTGLHVHWSTIGMLVVIWVTAPIVAGVLGFVLTRLLDGVPALRGPPRDAAPRVVHAAASGQAAAASAVPGSASPARATAGIDWLVWSLVAVGALASFTMGSNDVANATGSLVGSHTFSPLAAGLVGGLGLAFGVLTWGRPLLHRVAFDIVTVDRTMATAAQLVQAGVVLAAVAFGFFTSLNQALVGAMTGAGAARGRETVHAATLLAIVRGWVVGPGAGIAVTYGLARVVVLAAGAHPLLAK